MNTVHTRTTPAATALWAAGLAAAVIAMPMTPAHADTSASPPQPGHAASAPVRATTAPNVHLPDPDVLQLAPNCRTPAVISPGRPFTLTLGAFPAGTVDLYVDSQFGQVISSVHSAGTNPFAVDVTWPSNITSGSHQVYAVETTSPITLAAVTARCSLQVD